MCPRDPDTGAFVTTREESAQFRSEGDLPTGATETQIAEARAEALKEFRETRFARTPEEKTLVGQLQQVKKLKEKISLDKFQKRKLARLTEQLTARRKETISEPTPTVPKKDVRFGKLTPKQAAEVFKDIPKRKLTLRQKIILQQESTRQKFLSEEAKRGLREGTGRGAIQVPIKPIFDLIQEPGKLLTKIEEKIPGEQIFVLEKPKAFGTGLITVRATQETFTKESKKILAPLFQKQPSDRELLRMKTGETLETAAFFTPLGVPLIGVRTGEFVGRVGAGERISVTEAISGAVGVAFLGFKGVPLAKKLLAKVMPITTKTKALIGVGEKVTGKIPTTIIADVRVTIPRLFRKPKISKISVGGFGEAVVKDKLIFQRGGLVAQEFTTKGLTGKPTFGRFIAVVEKKRKVARGLALTEIEGQAQITPFISQQVFKGKKIAGFSFAQESRRITNLLKGKKPTIKGKGVEFVIQKPTKELSFDISKTGLKQLTKPINLKVPFAPLEEVAKKVVREKLILKIKPSKAIPIPTKIFKPTKKLILEPTLKPTLKPISKQKDMLDTRQILGLKKVSKQQQKQERKLARRLLQDTTQLTKIASRTTQKTLLKSITKQTQQQRQAVRQLPKMRSLLALDTSVPSFAVPITPLLTPIPLTSEFETPKRKPKKKKRKKRLDLLGYSEGFTSKILALSPRKITKSQAIKLLLEPKTGIPIRRPLLIVGNKKRKKPKKPKRKFKKKRKR